MFLSSFADGQAQRSDRFPIRDSVNLHIFLCWFHHQIRRYASYPGPAASLRNRSASYAHLTRLLTCLLVAVRNGAQFSTKRAALYERLCKKGRDSVGLKWENRKEKRSQRWVCYTRRRVLGACTWNFGSWNGYFLSHDVCRNTHTHTVFLCVEKKLVMGAKVSIRIRNCHVSLSALFLTCWGKLIAIELKSFSVTSLTTPTAKAISYRVPLRHCTLYKRVLRARGGKESFTYYEKHTMKRRSGHVLHRLCFLLAVLSYHNRSNSVRATRSYYFASRTPAAAAKWIPWRIERCCSRMCSPTKVCTLDISPSLRSTRIPVRAVGVRINFACPLLEAHMHTNIIP